MKLPRSLNILAEYLDDRGWEYDVEQNHGDNKTNIADTIYFVLGNDEIEVRSYAWECGLGQDVVIFTTTLDDLIDEELERLGFGNERLGTTLWDVRLH